MTIHLGLTVLLKSSFASIASFLIHAIVKRHIFEPYQVTGDHTFTLYFRGSFVMVAILPVRNVK